MTGRFCAACGAAVPGGGPGPVSSPAPAKGAAAPGGSALKVILILVGGLVLLGAMGIAGLVYVGYRAKQKIAEVKQEYGIAGGSAASSTSGVPVANFPPPKGSGCPMLEGQEASGILGVAIERVEFLPNGGDGSQECRYWVSAAERQRLAKSEIASGLGAMGKADEKGIAEGAEKLIGGALAAAIEASGDNKNTDCSFSVRVWRSGGQAMWDKFEATKENARGVTGADFAGLAAQPVQDLGDKASVLPGGHSIMVLKGNAFVLLGFQQFVPGRVKIATLARLVVGRL